MHLEIHLFSCLRVFLNSQAHMHAHTYICTRKPPGHYCTWHSKVSASSISPPANRTCLCEYVCECEADIHKIPLFNISFSVSPPPLLVYLPPLSWKWLHLVPARLPSIQCRNWCCISRGQASQSFPAWLPALMITKRRLTLACGLVSWGG